MDHHQEKGDLPFALPFDNRASKEILARAILGSAGRTFQIYIPVVYLEKLWAEPAVHAGSSFQGDVAKSNWRWLTAFDRGFCEQQSCSWREAGQQSKRNHEA